MNVSEIKSSWSDPSVYNICSYRVFRSLFLSLSEGLDID
jgi:hypothetical protein